MMGFIMLPTIRVHLLGSVWVEQNGETVKGFESRKALGVLCYLVLEPHPVTRTALINLFWPDKPESRGKGNLSRVLSNLTTLFPTCFEADRHTIQFVHASTVWVDTTQLGLLFKEKNLVSQTAAAKLYRGDFLEGFFLDDCPEFEIWVVEQREYWRQLAADCIQKVIAHHVSKSRYADCLAWGARLIKMNPWREEAHRWMMLFQALSGQKSAALRQYEKCKDMLRDILKVEPAPETDALYQAIQSDEIDVQAELGKLDRADPLLDLPNTFPQPATPFVGREKDLATLAKMLQEPHCRLLTLTGIGGLGKTRLAIQCAYEVFQGFDDGAYFVSLSSCQTPEQMVVAIAEVVKLYFSGTKPLDMQLVAHLLDKNVFLVLDNYEQLLPHTDLLLAMLKNTKHVKLLVTSRERLHMKEEWIFELDGLPYPVEGAEANLEGYESVQMFVQCAQKLNRRFALDDATALDVARICQQIQGLPLGIELASAWTWTTGCAEILEEIRKNLDFLTADLSAIDARHRSIGAVFEYSWNRLSPREKAVFENLSVFHGSFGQEAATVVADADVATLASLLDKSLLQHAHPGRYRVHKLLSQYGQSKLGASPDRAQDVARRHFRYYAGFLAERNERLKTSDIKSAVEEIQEELDDVQAAWRWGMGQRDHEALMPCVESLVLFYDKRNRFHEGEGLFREAIDGYLQRRDVDQLQDGERRFLEKLVSAQGRFCFRLGLYAQAQASFEQALKLTQSVNDLRNMAVAYTALGNVMFGLGQYQAAQTYHLESLGLQEKLDNPKGIADAQHNLAIVLGKLGNFEQAKLTSASCLAGYRKLNDAWGTASSLNNVGSYAIRLGHYDEAVGFLQEALALFQEIGDQHRIAVAYHNLGEVAYRQGRYEEAFQLVEENFVIRKKIQDRLGVAVALCELGAIHQVQGRYASAKRCFQQALELSTDINDQSGRAVALNLLAERVLRFRQSHIAKAYSAQSLEISERINNPLARANALVTLGRACIGEGEFDQALTHLAQSLQAFEEMKELLSAATARVYLGQCHLRAGDAKTAIERLRAGMLQAATLGAMPIALEGMLCALQARGDHCDPITSIEYHSYILHHPCPQATKAQARHALRRLREVTSRQKHLDAWVKGKRGVLIQRVADITA